MQTDLSWHLPVGLSDRKCQTIAKSLEALQNAKSQLPDRHFLKKAFPVKRAKLIDSAYQNIRLIDNPLYFTSLEGPNHSKLDYAVFVPSQVLKCSEKIHQSRTLLKAQRTLLNLEELQKAFPSHDFKRLRSQINELCKLVQVAPREFDILTRRITDSDEFQNYLEKKEEFLEEWGQKNHVEEWHSSQIRLISKDLEVAYDSIKKQGKFHEAPQILRYKDLEKFRQFHVTKHQTLCISHLDFWETEENQRQLLKLLSAVREKFGGSSPFHLFRFGNGFTYLICGFDDESFTQSLTAGLNQAVASLKPLLRLSNGEYCVLEADQVDRKFYFQCLKEALRPFIFYFNRTLDLNLSASFLKFFGV